MKFTTPIIYLTGLMSLTSASAIPRRDVVSDVVQQPLTIVHTLFSNIQHHTSSINSTTASLSPSSSEADTNTAALNVQADIKAITGLVSKAEGVIKTLPSGTGSQSGTLDLSNLLAGLVSEVDGTVSPLVNSLGLPGVADLVHNLDNVLGGLVQTLGAVVDGLLDVLGPLLQGLPLVGNLLGGLLGGLGLGLKA